MKKNLKKMIVMLGIVLGFTLTSMAISYGWGWVPESLLSDYQRNCGGIPHAYFLMNGEIRIINGELCYYGACACEIGYAFSTTRHECVRMNGD